jgi:hypothetical protein
MRSYADGRACANGPTRTGLHGRTYTAGLRGQRACLFCHTYRIDDGKVDTITFVNLCIRGHIVSIISMCALNVDLDWKDQARDGAWPRQ